MQTAEEREAGFEAYVERETARMNDVRIVLCEACGSEGRIYRGQYEDERDCGECPICEGTGSAVIEVEPVEIEDLDL